MTELTLALDASTGAGTLAILRGVELVAESRVAVRGPDGERMMAGVVALFEQAGASPRDLGHIVCGAGPGGFTSLRIAAAIAKGLASSLGVELWAMSSLALLAVGEGGRGESATRQTARAGAPVLTVLDALRGEWYCQPFGFDAAGVANADGPQVLLGRDALVEEAIRRGARVVGLGGAQFPEGSEATPRSADVVRLAPGPLLHRVDLATWEPDYGRLAEAQVKWEAAHGRALGSAS